MHHRSHHSPTPSHSNETEHRLTKGEVVTDNHETRIRYLEKAVQGLIYATAAVASSKGGDVAEIILSILTAKP